MNTIKTILLYIYCLPFRQLGGLVLAGTIISLLLYCATRKRKWQRPALLVISTAYILMVVCATLMGRGEPSASHGVSLLPFASYIRFAQGQTEMLRESVMNIVFFYPLGLLLGAANLGKRRWRSAVLAVFLLSAAIELCQWCFNLGYAEVDDVMHNTLGGGLGVLVIYITEMFVGFGKFNHKHPR